MKITIAAALAAAYAIPALAQDASNPTAMTCADFMALDQAGQTAAIGALRSSMGGMDSTDATGASDTTAGDAASTDAASTDTASTDTATGDTASADAGAGGDPMMTGLTAACEGNDTMMITDAMATVQGSMGSGGDAGTTDAGSSTDSGG